MILPRVESLMVPVFIEVIFDNIIIGTGLHTLYCNFFIH